MHGRVRRRRCTSGRNACLGKPATYQASWHRFAVGVDSVQLPEEYLRSELYAIGARSLSLATCSRIPVYRMVVDAYAMGGQAVAQAEGTQAWASLLRIRPADGIASGSSRAASSCLRSEVYAIGTRSLAGHMQPHISPSIGWWLMHGRAGGCTSGRNAYAWASLPCIRRAGIASGKIGVDSVQLPEERAVRLWRAITVAGHMQLHPRL